MPSPAPPPAFRILFVCLGNICRSPLAEAVFRHLVEREGLGSRFVVDSAGTGGWHVGEPPDARSAHTAQRRGIEVRGSARKVGEDDFDSFDLIVAMDTSNLRDLEAMIARTGGSVTPRLLREFDDEDDGGADGATDVPDPYYGGPQGFEDVFDIVFRSCCGLLAELRTELGC